MQIAGSWSLLLGGVHQLLVGHAAAGGAVLDCCVHSTAQAASAGCVMAVLLARGLRCCLCMLSGPTAAVRPADGRPASPALRQPAPCCCQLHCTCCCFSYCWPWLPGWTRRTGRQQGRPHKLPDCVHASPFAAHLCSCRQKEKRGSTEAGQVGAPHHLICSLPMQCQRKFLLPTGVPAAAEQPLMQTRPP